jgi:hypothetical protein
MAKYPKWSPPSTPELSPVSKAANGIELFRSIPPEIRVQIYSNVKDASAVDAVALITVLKIDQRLHNEALGELSTQDHTFQLSLKRSINDFKWLPTFCFPYIRKLSIE